MNTRSKSAMTAAATVAATGSSAQTTPNVASRRDDSYAIDAVALELQRVSISFTSATCSADTLESAPQELPEQETIASFQHTIVALVNKVYDALGNAQLEKTYQRALHHELRKLEVRGVRVESERSIDILYDGEVVGTRRADLVLGFSDGSHCILELKAVGRGLSNEHLKQLKYYMWSFKVPHGVLINFPRVPEFPEVDSDGFELTRLQGAVVLSNFHLRKRAQTPLEPEIHYVSNAEIAPPAASAQSPVMSGSSEREGKAP